MLPSLQQGILSSEATLARDLVEQLYETSLEPERLDELIAAWDERIGASDPTSAVELRQLAERDVIPHLARALAILDRITVAEAQRVQAVLAGVESAAMVIGTFGIVIAANQPAQVAHGLFPGDTISYASSNPVTLEILDRMDTLLTRGPGRRPLCACEARTPIVSSSCTYAPSRPNAAHGNCWPSPVSASGRSGCRCFSRMHLILRRRKSVSSGRSQLATRLRRLLPGRGAAKERCAPRFTLCWRRRAPAAKSNWSG